jgi:hypothetical protein
MDVDGEDDEHEKEGEIHNTTVVKEGAWILFVLSSHF